jgi:hypothetical protein
MASDQVELRRDGRWGGRVTNRALPGEDPSIDELDAEDRSELSQVWHARAASERRVAESFRVIEAALRRLGAPSDLVLLAERAVDDEHRHAELCRLVASRFHGSELPPPEALPHAVPAHRGASHELKQSLFVIGQSCMNETLASAFLEKSLSAAAGPTADVALRELLSDEIDHARLGWAYLATTTREQRAEIGPWLLPMAKANLRMWRESPRAYPDRARLWEQGAPSRDMVEEALLTAIGELIVPGLARFDLPTEGIVRWLADGAKTS